MDLLDICDYYALGTTTRILGIIIFLIGIIIYGAIVNSLGFLSVIPLFLIYKFLKKPQQHKDLINELEKRGLK